MESKIVNSLLLVGDFCISLVAVSLFGLASSRHYREMLWEKGGVEGWNSNPNHRVYFYANYEEPPEIPLIWSQQLTDGALAVGLLSLTILIARVIMTILGQMSRTFSMIYDIILTFFWIQTLVYQASGDFSDPKHPSPHPWYLSRYCQRDIATACRVAQASFALSVLAALLCGGRLVATAAEAVCFYYRTNREIRYRLVSMDPETMDEDDEASLEEEMAKERERYLYREALSPVLAFFPEDSRY
ncbi:hypothetical protein CDEST_14870 [Colletotrichum destructivum]|uniref:Integral membrane protein n=1 Tax=Colletotrichum destructivum TaxID=34406 RepID=A0AAX4J398_9PEZI|nr:hypothetical protein CDEST_14870 [Colletotrichum destructivum]